MATINGLTTLAGADVATGDYLPIYDASAATDKKVAAGSLAPTNLANTFTAAQTINAPSALTLQLSGTNRILFSNTSAANQMSLSAFDNGSSVGSRIIVNQNNNASTPAAGHIYLTNLGGTGYRIWPDTSGNLRIGTSDPTNANDTSGTVVGTQTSSLDAKDIAGDPLPAVDILAAVQAGAEAVRRFTYRSGTFNGEEFSGVVVDFAPRYGMDRDAEHPAGKSLNVITVIGDLLLAVANLAERVAALEAARE